MKYIKHLFIILIAANLFVSCDKNDNNATITGDDMLKVIAGRPELSLFNAAITRAKLEYWFTGAGPFTIFAPNNAAFNASGIMTAADLNSIDTNLLIQVLTYHFHAGLRTSYEIPNGPNANITTQSGFSFYASKTSSGTYINGAKVVTADVMASNGIIHIIDNVLVPPFTTAFSTLAANTNYKLFVQAINKSATTATFTGGLITVFAPTNAAMTAGGYDSATIANLNAAGITTLKNIVRYQVDTGRIFSSELKDGPVKTLYGTNMDFSAGGTKVKGTSNPTPFNITIKNMAVTNGVVHIIDGLLKY